MGFSLPGELLQDHSPLKAADLYGWVVDNDDRNAPDGKRLGRVKVRIPQLHRGIPDADLPWSFGMGSGQSHAGTSVGSFDVPPKGAKVNVSMASGDPHVLRYGSTIATEDVSKDNELVQHADYPHVKGFVDRAGNKLEMNTKDGKTEATYTHVTGSTIKIDNDGNVYVFSAKGMFLGAKEDIEIVSDKGVKVHAKGGALSLKGQPIQQNGSDGAASVKAVAARTRPTVDEKQNRTDL